MKKHYFLILALLVAFGMSACKDKTEPETPDDPGKESPLDVDNTVALSDDNRVIYEMNLYNFTKEGTFAAAQGKLADLRKLGIDIIWLMPIQPRSSEGKIGALGSPYALHDYTAVNPDHGKLEHLKAFVNKAHDLGMQVWLDWVPNHTGLDHVWVTEHPEYYKRDGKGNIIHPNNYSDVYQLDYSNNEMQKAMQEAMIYWIKNANIDGFRCDYLSSPYLPADFWSATIPKLQQAADRKIWMLGESDFQPEKAALIQTGFDYDYMVGFHWQLENEVGKAETVAKLRSQCRKVISNSAYNNMDRMIYLTNHDDIGNNFGGNYFSFMGNNVAPLTVMEFTLYGMPLLYNGQEIGYRKVQQYFQRDPIDWTAVDKRLQNTIRTLIALRHTQPALSSGKKANRGTTTFLTCSNSSFMAYTKKKDGNTVLVIISLATDEASCEIEGIDKGTYTQWLNSETIVDEIVKRDVELEEKMTFTLPKKGYAVYVKK